MMDDTTGKEPIRLVPKADKPLPVDADVVERLEYMLAEAKAGKVVGLALAWLDEDYRGGYMKVGYHNLATVGGLATIQQSISEFIRENAVKL